MFLVIIIIFSLQDRIKLLDFTMINMLFSSVAKNVLRKVERVLSREESSLGP